MTRATLALAVLLAVPDLALACATCIASAYGDRSYNVAYLGLILTPFAVALIVGAVITRSWWMRRHDTARPIEPQFNERREDAPVRCEDAPVETT